jgi:hypothetical protein
MNETQADTMIELLDKIYKKIDWIEIQTGDLSSIENNTSETGNVIK